MKTIKSFLFLIPFILGFSGAAQEVNIPFGTIPIIDGVISTDEWTDADWRLIDVQLNWEVKVCYKHSDSSLFFAFIGLKTTYGERYPDILLDIKNDKKNSWNPDDWWFHASYNDCEGHGNYNNWLSCIPDHPGWSANNFPLSEPGIIEMEISYSKIGLSIPNNDTIGIAFEVSDTHTDYHYFPFYAEIGDPSSWVNCITSKQTADIENQERKNIISVFPNPSKDFTTIKFSNPDNENYSLTIYSSTGQVIREIDNITGTEVKVENKNWEKGLYFFSLRNTNGKCDTGKFIIE
jgi:hypothetical protein